jgi:tRNA A-37 threonylcarbamoyl transferase component Bud32
MHAVTGAGRLIAGRYRLQGPLGRGAMGIVWRGRDELLARDVAVKEVQIASHASPVDAEAIYQRTLREARTAARLKHPNVVTVYDVVEEAGTPWIVMELVEARPLDRVITEDGPLPPLQAAELGASLLSALSAAHASGVLHRDVKPSNVLVTGDSRAVLTDFGIATFSEDPSMTQAGMVVGTPGFTAPERVRGEAATPASDLWSLGATLYAAVEGRGPFERAGGSSVITAGVAAEDAPRAPSAGPLGPVIDALLSRDPGTRPDATTATRLLDDAVTAARTGTRPRLAPDGGPAGAGTSPVAGAGAGSAAADGYQGEEHAAFLDPPVFAALSMPDLAGRSQDGASPFGIPAGSGPSASTGAAAQRESAAAGSTPGSPGQRRADAGGPVLWQPVPAPRSGGASGGPASPGVTGAAAAGGGSGGSVRFWRRDGQSGPSARWWRLMVAGAGVAAIAVAAVIGWSIYDHSDSAQALQNASLPTGTVTGTAAGFHGAGGGNSGTGPQHSNAPSSGTSAESAAARGKSPAPGKPGARQSGSASPGSSVSASPGTSTSPSPSPSPSSSPSPSPSTSPGLVLPAGYVWHHFSAAILGSTAGFKIGMPSPWTQSVSGQAVHLNQPARNFHLTVGLGLWTYVKPLAQAQYLKKTDATAYRDFTLENLQALGFKQAGGAIGASAAELKFSWTKVGGTKFTAMVLLVTLSTKSGFQPYAFTLSAPSATYGAAYGIFHTALGTFRPVPGA